MRNLALVALAVVLSDGALSARDPAGAGAGRGSRMGDGTIFRFITCKNQKMPYVVRAVRTERRAGEARLRDKEKGRGEKFLFGVGCNPLISPDSDE
jgi:hypothetical protein